MERHSTPHIHNPAVLRAVVNCDRGYGAASDYIHTQFAEGMAASSKLDLIRKAITGAKAKTAAVAALGAAGVKAVDWSTGKALDAVDNYGKERRKRRMKDESFAPDARTAWAQVLAEAATYKWVKGVLTAFGRNGKPLTGSASSGALRMKAAQDWAKANPLGKAKASAARPRPKATSARPRGSANRVAKNATAQRDWMDAAAAGIRKGGALARSAFGKGSYAAGALDKGFNSKHRALYAGLGVGAVAGGLGMRQYHNADPDARRAWARAKIDSRYEQRTGRRGHTSRYY